MHWAMTWCFHFYCQSWRIIKYMLTFLKLQPFCDNTTLSRKYPFFMVYFWKCVIYVVLVFFFIFLVSHILPQLWFRLIVISSNYYTTILRLCLAMGGAAHLPWLKGRNKPVSSLGTTDMSVAQLRCDPSPRVAGIGAEAAAQLRGYHVRSHLICLRTRSSLLSWIN